MAGDPCSDTSCTAGHLPVKVYTRAWRRLRPWRKALWVRCWHCELKLPCTDAAEQRRLVTELFDGIDLCLEPITEARYDLICIDLGNMEAQLDG